MAVQNPSMQNPIPKNTICLWFDKDAQEAARFYAATFPDSQVTAVHHAPSDYPSGKAGDVLTVEFTVLGIACLGLNGGPAFQHSEAFSFQVATDTQEETGRYWNAIAEAVITRPAPHGISLGIRLRPRPFASDELLYFQ